jgi:hypothetical protein
MTPEPIESEIINDPDKVSLLLEEWGLSTKGILAVRDAAHAQLVDASPLMATNAPGSLAYHYGVFEMRVQFLGKKWHIDRSGGIEAITNVKGDRKVVFQNVDIACSWAKPSPRTKKGSGSEKECQGNLFDYYNVKAPETIQSVESGIATHFIMVDERGAVEFSRPVLEDGVFVGFVQRLFVSDGSDLDVLKVADNEPNPPIDDFDVAVSRR